MAGAELVGCLVALDAQGMEHVAHREVEADFTIEAAEQFSLRGFTVESDAGAGGKVLSKRFAELAQLDQGGIGIGGEDLFGGAGQLQEDGVVLGEKGEIAGNGQAPDAVVVACLWHGREFNALLLSPASPLVWRGRGAVRCRPLLLAQLTLNTLQQLRNGELAGARRLQLACGLTEFPHEIFTLADSLEILDLSGNALTALPDDLPRLHRLRVIFCSGNPFAELPAVLGRCPQLEMLGFKSCRIESVPAAALPEKLRWLILTDNQVAELPPEIGQCTRLQKLMLAGNRLTALPAELAECRNLELLRIAANQLTVLPDWLFSLPRLSWLAYAGNPFCAKLPIVAVEPIDWAQLTLGEKLGEGASGIIHRAEWQADEASKPVAVKLFKGTLTSDGLPQSEMHACLAAGEHPNLIPVLGRVAEHPGEVDGLVMALIGHGFKNLAGPPSLDSCTRDIYAADAAFSLDAALRLAHGIAAAARHLHAQGITHGDLYAHNILHLADGAALLGDFGAASPVDQDDAAQALALERIEVRAFGCLLEELLARCRPVGNGAETIQMLADLQVRCAAEILERRPLFTEIVAALAQILAKAA
ncbi:MAG: serine/threonine protein kinase [Proteobacteria bacterium]|nr:serine/threonine protein kinase [Pseudomonadota bacterium]